MKVERFIKFLNNTELGKGNTNETYIYINKDFNVDFLFLDYLEEFESKTDPKQFYPLRLEKGNETRIVGLGTYYRRYELEAGDAIVLERIVSNGGTNIKFVISHVKKSDVMVLQKVGVKGFEILRKIEIKDKDILKIEKVIEYNNRSYSHDFKFVNTEKKRKNSPKETDFYSFQLKSTDGFSNIDLLQEVNHDEMVEIIEFNEYYLVKRVQPFFTQNIF